MSENGTFPRLPLHSRTWEIPSATICLRYGLPPLLFLLTQQLRLQLSAQPFTSSLEGFITFFVRFLKLGPMAREDCIEVVILGDRFKGYMRQSFIAKSPSNPN